MSILFHFVPVGANYGNCYTTLKIYYALPCKLDSPLHLLYPCVIAIQSTTKDHSFLDFTQDQKLTQPTYP